MRPASVRLRAAAWALLLAGAAQAAPLTLDGEIAAQDSAVIAPPFIQGLWNYQIVELAADGSRVKAGDVVVAFDAGELQRRLLEAQGKLNEKRSARATLVLDLAERARREQLTVAEARSNREKAGRKAQQPVELLRSVDYRKLVVEREQAERRAELLEQRAERAADQRRAEQALVDAEVAQLEEEVARLSAGIAAVRVLAPRDGIVLVRSSWRGERFETGSQVFMGQAIAEIPDPASLGVRATVAERDLLKIAAGQRVRVRVEGGAGATLSGRIDSIGRSVRSKSRLQPVPVVDVQVALDAPDPSLKPGQAVRVEVLP